MNVEGETIKDAIMSAISTYPKLGPLPLNDGEIRPYANIMSNGTRVLGSEGMTMKVKANGDTAMFPPMAGG